MFHPDRDIHRIIIETLGKDGKSISRLSRELESEGLKFHRLILTGYLRAMTDMGVLREREVPPAKIYVPTKNIRKDAYQTIASEVRAVVDPKDVDGSIKGVLYRLFKRPIFEEELKRAGVSPSSDDVEATSEEREEARKLLNKRGFRIPKSMPCFVYDLDDPDDMYTRVMEGLALRHIDGLHLVLETRQTRLD